ncbi:hypothetical protein BLJ79_14975 [Arthrobacter sp. UCD-GKA]|nr:hypothetical protein BLJ79_14975 [Arthrobacter sp. UCD-GKA]
MTPWTRPEVQGLDRSLLCGYRLAAQARRVNAQLLRIARGHGQSGTALQVGDEVHGLAAFVGDAEGGHAQVVLARLQAGQDGVEGGRNMLDLQAQHRADGVAHVGVPADQRLVVGVVELERGVGRVRGNAQYPRLADVCREQGPGGLVDAQGHGGR